MPKSHRPYPAQFRQRIIELVRKGRTPEELGRQFEPSAQPIRNWVRQADRDAGRRQDGLTTVEQEELRHLPRENRALREEREIPKKGRGLVCAGDHLDPVQGFEFVTAHQAVHPVAAVCRTLGVSPSGYYAWRKHPLSPRAQADLALAAQIEAVHRDSRGTYGAPRIRAGIAAQGLHIGRKRVARLMRTAGLQGVSRRKFRTTVRDETARPAPDLVERQFPAAGPDRLWVADITHVATWAGVLYLAVVLDAWSRRIIGWAMESHPRTELVMAALNMAVAQRRPRDVIHHSDQGCQYTSLAFGGRCREAGVRPSMGSVGDAYDNAMCESFFARLERELLDRRCFRTQADARLAVFDFIEGWYNQRRRHSALDYGRP